MRESLRVLLVVVVVAVAKGDHRRAADRTIIPGEAGYDVVVATVDLLRELDIFPYNNRLLRRIAYAETRDGVDFTTYRPGYDGGIWQVDEMIFLQTQNVTLYPDLAPLLERIRQVTGQDWGTLPWNALRRPFFSGMAASLYLAVLPVEIPGPGDVAGQAGLWKEFYNSDPRDSEETFIDAVEEFESEGNASTITLSLSFPSNAKVYTRVLFPTSYKPSLFTLDNAAVLYIHCRNNYCVYNCSCFTNHYRAV